MLSFRTIASGSSGNAALLSWDGVHLLIDMGVSCRRICQALADQGLRPEDLAAVLITHEHTDHISGLATYIKKYRTHILATPGTARQLHYRLAGIAPLLWTVPIGEEARWGDVSVRLFPTSHDCAESAAFRFDTPDGSLGYLTDTGFIPQETGEGLLGADLLVLESNHDVDMLLAGPYPYQLKRRVLGDQGHLSNDAAAGYAADSVQAGTQAVILAHLSHENNFPALALETVGQALAETGRTVPLTAAPRSCPGEEYRLERALCRR